MVIFFGACVCVRFFSFFLDAILVVFLFGIIYGGKIHTNTNTLSHAHVCEKRRDEKRMLFMSTFYTPVKRSMLGDLISMCVCVCVCVIFRYVCVCR